MAWWQKKLLQYALSRTGLLDEQAINLDNYDINLGRRNVIELRDVGLNIQQIAKYAKLPPGVRIETARILSLRLTLPADIYRSSIEAEVDGVQLGLSLENEAAGGRRQRRSRERSPVARRSPEHRKVHRRARSPPPYDPGGLSESDEDVHLPTTEELAQSFLLQEPAYERKELEASLAAGGKGADESVMSESSNSEVGTGGGIGLPGFLSGFLQGVIDRVQVRIKNVEVNVDTQLPGEAVQALPVTLRLRVGSVELQGLESTAESGGHAGKRHIKIMDVAIDLLSDDAVFAQLSEIASPASPRTKRSTRSSLSSTGTNTRLAESFTEPTAIVDAPLDGSHRGQDDLLDTSVASFKSVGMAETRFHDMQSPENASTVPSQPELQDLDIQPGDDNVSWGSRRSKSSAPTEDLWGSMASEEELPESLLLDRATTPRPDASRQSSPTATRTRRAVSPYDRGIRSPGSWPRLEESPDRQRALQSPGSWPNLDQSQQSMFQPLTPGPALEDDPMDNKRAALESSAYDSHDTTPPDLAESTMPEPPSAALEDMAQSRFYSHEEAESLYMSAMTQSPRRDIPGGWGSEDVESECPEPPDAQARTTLDGAAGSHPTQSAEETLVDERPDPSFDLPTPRPQSPISFPKQPRDSALACKRLVTLDEASLWFALQNSSSKTAAAATDDRLTAPPTPSRHGMPGTFSAYSELRESRYQGSFSGLRESTTAARQQYRDSNPGLHRSRAGRDAPAASHKQLEEEEEWSFEINVGSVDAQIDLSACRLLYKVATSTNISQPKQQASKTQAKQQLKSQAESMPLSVCATVRCLQLSVLEYLPSGHTPKRDVGLLDLTLSELQASQRSRQLSLDVAQVKAWLSGSELLAFDKHNNLGTSVVLNESSPDIHISINNDKMTVEQRPVTDINVVTKPVKVKLDLGALDDTLGSFGGLSGLLELSNSLLTDAGIPSSPVAAKKPSKGVRFQGEPPAAPTGPLLKLNVRFNGVDATLRGEACAASVRTTSLKVIYREQAAAVVIDHVVLSGPHFDSATAAPLAVDLSGIRIEYLPTPQHKDLERLVSLVNPSKDKYDDDDDVLVEIMLAQRRKGPLARVVVSDLKLNMADFECLDSLIALGRELNKLSVVAKYLPEDERPGLLSLIRIKDVEAQLPVNQSFGKIYINAQDFHCAHVGLPLLLTFSVGDIHAARPGQEQLIHALLPGPSSEGSAMIMARMLGDEEEPTVKIKLYNMCLEYSVPVLVALTGDPALTAEKAVTDLAQSVAGLATKHYPQDELLSPSTGSATKRTKIDLLVHESAIGLTPEKLQSKALVILADAKLTTHVPPTTSVAVFLEFRKAAIFVTNVRSQPVGGGLKTGRSLPSNTAVSTLMTTALGKQGYLSVGSLMSARVHVTATDTAKQLKAIEIELSNELFLLETCADSTQTLLATFGALAPPATASTQPQYLTQPMTIEDMMASFTGDAFEKPERPPETLFDVEEEPDDSVVFGMGLDASALQEAADDLLAESEMTSSLYGPVSGILGGVDQPDDDEPSDLAFPESAESLLEEEDPFEMTISPVDVGMSDAALMRDLAKQSSKATSDQIVHLGLEEYEDLGLDALGTNQQALGSRDRFNGPSARSRKLLVNTSQKVVPFRLRVRDTHVIWNIHDGYDWERTRDKITQAVEEVEARAEERIAQRRRSYNEIDDEESVIGDFLFNSIYVGVPANADAQELRRQINRGIDDLVSETESVPVSGMSRPTAYSASGRPIRRPPPRRLKLERSKSHKVAFELKGIAADILVFPPDAGDTVSTVDVRVKDVVIFDNVPTSTWRKFLAALDDGPRAREMSKPMAHIEMQNVRTLQDYAASELIMKVSVLPLRLHVDQDALDFIVRFFEFKDESVPSSGGASDQPFIQRLEVETVDLCLDYKPKRLDYGGLRSGHTTELMNLITLDAANICLKHAIVYGIKGFDPIHKTLNDIWMPDVRRNQLPTVLAGLAPVRSLVNIGTGIRDVVAIPIREYRKDGRVVRSIQKGALHFGKTTTSELARLGAKLAIGTQNILQGAEGLLSPSAASPSNRPGSGRRASSEHAWHDAADEDDREQRAISAYANQPVGVFSGLRSARAHLERDLLTARDAFIAVQGEILDSGSPGAAAAAVARHAPTVILRPVIGASRAVGTTLLGVGNQIDRQNVRRAEDKYKRR